MSAATSQMRKFARRLMAYEAHGNKPVHRQVPAAFHVCDQLRPKLATLMGNLGFRALLSRAVVLASEEIPWLRGVQVGADGSLVGLEPLLAEVGPDKFFDGRAVVLAELLGLLVAFIGESLTLGLVREIWPDIPLDDLDFEFGGKNEKTK